MPRYYIGIREVHVSHRLVQAENANQAVELAGDTPEEFLEYSHTLDKETWTTEEIPSEKSSLSNTHYQVGGDHIGG